MSYRPRTSSVSGDLPPDRMYAATTSGSQASIEPYGFTNRPCSSYDAFTARPIERQAHSQHDTRMVDAASQPSQRFATSTFRELPSSTLPSIEAARAFPAIHYPATYPQGVPAVAAGYTQSENRRRSSHDNSYPEPDSPSGYSYTDFEYESSTSRAAAGSHAPQRYHSRRKIYNQDEFDGPSQLLSPPSPRSLAGRERRLPELPVNLTLLEQEDITSHLNEILSQCAFHFIAKYSFPVPLDRDKPQVRGPADREWTEWAYLLKKLATKRRIPAKFLFDNQIKQFVTTVENALIIRRPSVSRDHGQAQSRLLRDDRHVLQQISAGTQFAKIVMDAMAMEQLDELYLRTEHIIRGRRAPAAAAIARGPSGVHFFP